MSVCSGLEGKGTSTKIFFYPLDFLSQTHCNILLDIYNLSQWNFQVITSVLAILQSMYERNLSKFWQ